MKSRIANLFAALFVIFACLGARAEDTIVLRDGSLLRGRIVRELDGNLWLRQGTGGISHERMLLRNEIARVDHGPDDPEAVRAVAAAPRPGVPRAAIITLGDESASQGDKVGVYVTAYALEHMLPLLEEQLGDSGVVVFRIRSGGGSLAEVQPLSDVIQNQYKKKFRTVAWIDSAISAAAMTSHCIEEIYFMPRGTYGACTAFTDGLVAVKDRPLEEILYMMEKISARGGYDPLLMRAMQQQIPVSYTRQENGAITLYRDATSGENVLNREGEILTLTSETARQVGFSKGTAANTSELTKLMGYQELVWVGEETPGIAWPVCKAEKWNIHYRTLTQRDESHIAEYLANLNAHLGAAEQTQDRAVRGRLVALARENLRSISRMTENNPNMVYFQLRLPTQEAYRDWRDKMDRMLRELMK